MKIEKTIRISEATQLEVLQKVHGAIILAIVELEEVLEEAMIAAAMIVVMIAQAINIHNETEPCTNRS